MDWEQLREKTLGEVGTTLVAEGAGVTGGFLAAGFLGRQIQDRIKPDGAIVSTTDKLVAWSANNVPKIAMWYLLKKYASVEPGETLTPMKEATVDAKKAVAGSIIFDTLVRLSSGGQNPASVTLFGYRLLSGAPEKSASSQADNQRLIQENSALRAELNKALQRLATPAVPPAPPAPQVVHPPVIQQPMQSAPVVHVQQPVQPAPVVHVQQQPMYQQPMQPPVQVVQQAAPQPPPVVRYQPVTPPVIPYQAPPTQTAQPVQVHVQPQPVAAQPVPPAISERDRRYGFMQYDQTPPAVQERQKQFGFMKSGEEKDIAAMFGML